MIQGVGGAILTPQSLSLIATLFPPEKRGAAFGVWGGVAGIAAVAGPTLGGFLTTTFSWRAIFYVNVPIGIIAVILAYLLMPELTIHRKHHLDVVGVLLAMSGLFAGVFGLIEGERYSWGRISDLAAFDLGSLHLGLLSIPTILLASVVLLALFLKWEARQQEPLLPLSLFKDRNFSLANLVQTFVAFAMLGLFLPLTIFLQSVLGFSAERAGIALAPMSLTMMFVAPFAGRLTDKVNGKWILATGMTLYAIGMTLIVLVSSLSSTARRHGPFVRFARPAGVRPRLPQRHEAVAGDPHRLHADRRHHRHPDASQPGESPAGRSGAVAQRRGGRRGVVFGSFNARQKAVTIEHVGQIERWRLQRKAS